MENNRKQQIDWLTNSLIPAILNNGFQDITTHSITSFASSLGFIDESAGFFTWEEGDLMQTLQSYTQNIPPYFFIPLYYLGATTIQEDDEEDDWGKPFQSKEDYLQAVQLYQEYYQVFKERFTELLGNPFRQDTFKINGSVKTFNNFGENELYNYAIWREKNLLIVLQQDVSDLEFEDDINLAIVEWKSINSLPEFPLALAQKVLK